MESRTDLVRLLEEMDKVLDSKRKELAELDERLEAAREKVSKKEASEIQEEEGASSGEGASKDPNQDESVRRHIAEQKSIFEKQLVNFSEQLSELESENQKLREENYAIQQRQADKEDKGQQLETAYRTLSDQYQELYKENTRLFRELAQAESKSTEQQEQLEKSNQLDKVLENLYEGKLNDLKKIIEFKDEVIKQLKADNQFTLEFLGINPSDKLDSLDDRQTNEFEPVDSDKKKQVIKIAEIIRDKESQIEALKNQLSEATRELEKSASLLELITSQQEKKRTAESENQVSLNEQLAEVNRKCERLERELEYKDKTLNQQERSYVELAFLMPEKVRETLHALVHRLNSNPRGSHGMIEILCRKLNNLLTEARTAQEFIKKNLELQRTISQRDRQIRQLVDELNQLHSQFNIAVRSLKVATGEIGDWKSDDDYKSVENIDEPSEELDAHESSSEPGAHVEILDGEPQDITKESERVATPIRTSVEALETIPKLPLPVIIPPFTEACSLSLETYVNESVGVESAISMQRRLRQLENENEFLEMAMKEILMSIRWSDSQCSTLLIECPSLERLCQILEARYVAESNRECPGVKSNSGTEGEQAQRSGASSAIPNTFQFILLKGELDLLRGQNEQLRVDIKTLRRDYQELLKNGVDKAALQCTNFLSSKFAATMTEVGNSDSNRSMQDSTGLDAKTMSESHEAECQTEPTLDLVSSLVEKVQSSSPNSEVKKCQSCRDAQKVINYLIASVARLEVRVELSDNNYMSRFKNWSQLINMLARDLGDSTESLRELRKEYHMLHRQKQQAESKVEFLKLKVMSHLETCPISKSMESFQNFEVRKDHTNVREDSRPRIASAVRTDKKAHLELPTTSARVIITLLKSIVGCLQARLDFKDHRIHELERFITEIPVMARPA